MNDLVHETEKIKSTLDLANSLECDEWQIWRFIPKLKVLFLCGYNKPFKVLGFLAFQDVTFIELPQIIRMPKFLFENPKNMETNMQSVYYEKTILINSAELKGQIRATRIQFISDKERI